jgi:hypothetical protein
LIARVQARWHHDRDRDCPWAIRKRNQQDEKECSVDWIAHTIALAECEHRVFEEGANVSITTPNGQTQTLAVARHQPVQS